MAIDAGDAVLNFLADTTEMDTAFEKIPGESAKAAEAVQVSGAQMQEALHETGYSASEAKGEIALLGEEMGVRLPRHVRSFVAELPGVGSALSAAFSATAVLFLLQALVEITEKATKFAEEFFYGTSALEASQKASAELNGELLGLSKTYEELKKKADDYGKTALELAREHEGEVKQSVADLTKQLKGETDQLVKLTGAGYQHMSMWAALKQGLSGIEGGFTGLAASMAGAYAAYKENNDGVKQLEDTQAKLLTTAGKLKVAQQEHRIATEEVAKAQDDLNKKGEELNAALARGATELEKLNEAMARTANVFKSQDLTDVPIASFNALAQHILKTEEAAHRLGLTTRTDLVLALQDAKTAMKDFTDAGGQDSVVLAQFNAKILEAQKNLLNFGKAQDTIKLKGQLTWKALQQEMKQGADVTRELGQAGEQAFDGLAKGVEGAFASVLAGQKSLGKALEEATAQALIQLASQALVKSLFYTAEGFAALATPGGQAAAGQYFLAAGEMAAVGAAAGVAGAGLSGGLGGGSSNGNYGQAQTSQNNATSQAGGRGSVGVQQFGDGALVSGPTLAAIGERAGETEAVLPLDHPAAMQRIGQAIAAAGGTGSGRGIHVHVQGLISDDNLTKVIAKIDRKVKSGGATLTSSNSLRTTKRSI